MFKNKVMKAPVLPLAVLLLSIGSRYIDAAVIGYGDTLYLSLIILQLLVMALPAIFYAKTAGPGYSLTLRLGPLAPSRFWFTATALLTLIFGSSVIRLTMSYMGISGSLFGEYSSMTSVSLGSPADVLYVIIAFAAVPAICEEFVFRAVILTEYGESGGFTAVVFSALLCALTRFDPSVLTLFFFNGVIYALTVIITRSVFASMLLHVSFNIFNLFFEKYILRVITQNEYATLCAFVLISAFLLSMFLMFSEAERIYHNEAITKPPTEDSAKDVVKPDIIESFKKFLYAAASPTFILCVVAFLFGWLMS